MKLKTILTTLLVSGSISITAVHAIAKEGGDHEKAEKAQQAQLRSKARITRAEAEKTALTKAPGGKVQGSELEEEAGKLVWSFDITTPDTKDITEVLVDAKTGTVVSVEKEQSEDEAKERAEEHHDKDDDKY